MVGLRISSSLLLALVLSGCADTPLWLTPGLLPGQVLLEFEGEVRDDDIVFHVVHAVDADGVDVGDEVGVGDDEDEGITVSVPGETQALTRIREDKNGTPGSAGALDGIELVVERNAPYTAPATITNGCGAGANSFEVTVSVRNFFQTDLSNVYTEINTISAPGHELCNSDKTTPNLVVDGVPLITTNGLVRYGNLLRHTGPAGTAPSTIVPPPLGADTTAQAMLWRFRAGTGTFSFTGRVVADICAADCTAGTIYQESPTTSVANAFPFGETNGVIDEVVEGDGVVYAAGTFTAAGPRTGIAFATTRGAASTGAATTPWAPLLGGEVRALEADGQGGFYAGGSFTQVGNLAIARLVHIKPDGNIDTTFAPTTVTASTFIRALHFDVANNVLWVGRDTAPFLSALKGDTGAVAFSVVQPNDKVFDIVRSGNVVAVSGEFNNFGVNTRDKLAVFDRAGALQPFAVSVGGNGNISVDAIATDGTTLWFAGEFTAVNTLPRGRAAAATIANSALLAWNPNFDDTVNEIQLVPGATPVIVAAGLFLNVQTTPRQRIAAINANPVVGAPNPLQWNPGAGGGGGVIDEVFVDSGIVYAAGNFTAFGGAQRPSGLGAVAATFGVPSPAVMPWNPITATSTRHVISADTTAGVGGRILVGGAFAFGGYVPRANVVAFDLDSGAVTDFVADTNGTVSAAALSGNKLFLGGSFTTVNGATHARIAAVDSVTGAVDNAFTVAVDNGAVFALATSPTHLYVGGSYTAVNAGTARNRLTRFSLAGALDATWVPNSNSTVNAIAVDGTDVFVGGQFTRLNAINNTARRWARLSTAAGAAILNDYNAASSIFGLSVNRGVVYAGGSFTTVGGVPRNRAAAIDRRTNALTAFNPNVGNNNVRTVSAAGSTVALGGNFTTVGGQARRGAAVVDAGSGALLATNPFLSGTVDVNSAAIIGRVVFFGGAFTAGGVEVDTAGTTTARSFRSRLAAINAD